MSGTFEHAGPATATAAPDQQIGTALELVAAGAAHAADRGDFPEASIVALERAGAFTASHAIRGSTHSRAREWDVVRAVARADGSTARILDGHLNALERVALLSCEPVRERVLSGVRARSLRLGVWGADPAGGEGERARLRTRNGGRVLEGVKVFCSGAGGLDLAVVAAASEDARAPLLALVDLSRGVAIDRSWYGADGMRASASHRVEFSGAPVVDILGGPGELTRQPWISLDALRTSASWVGMIDALVGAALSELSMRTTRPGARSAAGRLRRDQLGAAAVLSHVAQAAADPWVQIEDLAGLARANIYRAARSVLAEAQEATGSSALVRNRPVARIARDLGTFVLQHPMEPVVEAAGERALATL